MSARDAKGRILPGHTLNPGGKPKRVLELQQLALSESAASFKVIIALRDNANEESRVRLAAAKLLIAYGIGEPPKVVEIDAPPTSVPGDPMDALTIEELRALARQSLVDDATASDDVDDDSDEAPH